jgi:hypothetical protein
MVLTGCGRKKITSRDTPLPAVKAESIKEIADPALNVGDEKAQLTRINIERDFFFESAHKIIFFYVQAIQDNMTDEQLQLPITEQAELACQQDILNRQQRNIAAVQTILNRRQAFIDKAFIGKTFIDEDPYSAQLLDNLALVQSVLNRQQDILNNLQAYLVSAQDQFAQDQSFIAQQLNLTQDQDQYELQSRQAWDIVMQDYFAQQQPPAAQQQAQLAQQQALLARQRDQILAQELQIQQINDINQSRRHAI